MDTMPDRLVRVSIAVRIAGIPLSAAHVTRLIKWGKVSGMRVGRRFYTTVSAVQALFEVKP